MSELAPVKLGFCTLCGKRVFSDEKYVKSSEGYCHRNCITRDTNSRAEA